MTLSRRRVLAAAATAPAVLAFPAVRAAGAAVTLSGVHIIDASALSGLSLSWLGAGLEPVATVRARTPDGWSAPVPVAADHGHGPPDAEGREHGPVVLVPEAEAYEISVLEAGGAHDIRLHPLQRETTLGLLAAPELTTVSPQPGLEIVERSNWTTRGRRDTIDCVIGSSVFGLGCRSDVGIRHAVVHHTVNVNDYVEADVPELLRAIQRYHMDTRGWDDIAYNFVIDRFGRIWHAREAELDEPITGGHTTGLNAESVGVAVLGTFTEVDPGQAVVDSLVAVLGWKLALHGVDPLGDSMVRSGGGDFAEPGEKVLVDNISGHRDNQITTCPGDGLYNRIPEVRSGAAELVPVYGSVVPGYHDDRIAVRGWAEDRFSPTGPVDIDITVDGAPFTSFAVRGRTEPFELDVPIDIDSTSVTITARAPDGRTASLMDLVLFATFIDVQPHRFFAPGVYWLKDNDLTTGTIPGLFEPMDEMSRAQMATFLHRFMGRPAAAEPSPFSDVARGTWYTAAVDWLAETGITKGTAPEEFSPGELVTRGQIATFLWRLCGRIEPSGPMPFTDVPEGRYDDVPVRWMYETGITTGTGPDTYSPDDPVTRGEIATLLHRLAQNPDAWTVVEPPFPISS